MAFVKIQDRQLEYEFVRGIGDPVLVFLHEGLGSVSMWKDFPEQCGRTAGCDVLVYSRYGYGGSDRLTEKRQPDYMHHEALRVLPELLDRLEIERPVLVGHSDGASIALIHAGGSGRDVRGVIAMAPHVMVEGESILAIREIRQTYESTDLRDRLARYHSEPDATFFGWHDIWLDPAFRDWNIEEYLPKIACPILAIQGSDDEYATMEHIYRMAHVVAQMEIVELGRCRHSPHRDRPEAVIQSTSDFVAKVR